MARAWAARSPAPVPDDLSPLPPGGPLGALLARLLWVRGVRSATDADAFLEPTLARGLRPPSAVPGLEPAATAIDRALAAERSVAVVSADDVPSIVATAVLRRCLPAGRGDPGARIDVGPSRVLVDGVAIDGTTLGLDVAGIAFYLLIGLRRRLRDRDVRDVPDPRSQLDLAALGALAAGTILRDEARVLVALGLRAMQDEPRPGFAALADRTLIARPTARAVVAHVVPRLAAAIANGGAGRVLELLTTTSVAAAEALAASIELDAAERRHDAAVPAGDLAIDGEWPIAEANARLVLALGRLEPHGPGNPEPVLVARAVRLDGARLAGDPTRPYWRLRLRQDGHTLRATAQHLRSGDLELGTLYDVAYTPRIGHARGGDIVETVVHDLRRHRPEATDQDADLTPKTRLS